MLQFEFYYIFGTRYPAGQKRHYSESYTPKEEEKVIFCETMKYRS